jgi:hypothetical protein
MERIKATLTQLIGAACLAGLVIGGVACGKKATCDEVSKHIVDIMLSDKNIPEEAKKNKDALVKQMVEECNKSKPPQGQMDCALKAKDMAALEKCDKGGK